VADVRAPLRAGEDAVPGRAAPRVGVIGISTAPTCGVRGHATLLCEALSDEHVSCTVHWLQREHESLGASRRELAAWTRGLAAELDRERLDAIVLHYSVFAYSHRGFPVFVPPTVSALRAVGVPLVTVLHEYAYPWKRDGARGAAWAVTQRGVLFEVMRASSGVLVTTADRAQWLASRAWLPRRPAVVAPVFSTLPEPAAGSRPDPAATLVGLFGYTYEPRVRALVLDALAHLQRAGVEAQLQLIGAPGPSSEVGQRWLSEARVRGLVREPSFSGRLPAQELSDRLAECEVLLSMDPSGPMSRKTTLAASLASGRPLLALDGRRTWAELIDAQAAVVVAPDAEALAGELAGLLEDQDRRAALGARGRAFAARTMTAQRSAELLAGMLSDILSGRS
jgi:glycosyltransferase involved in cell wall biosynthesis